MENKTERNSNIELLRIILMLMVVTLHFNNGEMGGAFNFVENNPTGRYFLYFFESLSICAVNCFMVISGYFLAYNKKVKLGKIIDLLLIVIFYREIDYVVSVFLGLNDFSVKGLIFGLVPCNYFAIFYIVSYIFSPFIVKIFDSTTEKQQLCLVSVVVLIFIVWPTIMDCAINLKPGMKFLYGISTITGNGNGAGYTIVQFVADVIIGMYLRRANVNVKAWKLLLVYLGSALIMMFGVQKFSSLYNYCSVFTVTSAVSLFLLFNKLNIKSRIINLVSKSVFPIFCLHVSASAIDLWKKYFITAEHVGSGTWRLVLWSIISIAAMFLSCLIIDVIFRYTFGLIKNKIVNKCPVIMNIEE